MSTDLTADVPVAQRPLSGISTLIRILYNKGDVTPQFNALVARYMADCMDVPALMDLSLLLHTTGQMEKGLEMQAAAIQMQRVYKRVHGTGAGLRVLSLMTAGDMTANTPVDFLLEGSDFTLYLAYMDANESALPVLPEVDVVFMAIGEAPASRPVLHTVGRFLSGWNGAPVLNGDTQLIANMTRNGVHAALAGEASILSPRQEQIARASLDKVAQGAASLSEFCSGLNFPIIARPIGTHAGEDLDRLMDVEALRDYLGRQTAEIYYVAPFIDSRNADGLFRKQRVAFIKGKPFASHMAVSDHWMVHYLTAEMDQRAERRHEEEVWMQTFDEAFAVRYAEALAALYRAFPLDYFGIDCIGLEDGRLLVFEVDNIMIVHDMDDAEVFAYKKPVMRKLFAAFQAMLQQAALGR